MHNLEHWTLNLNRVTILTFVTLNPQIILAKGLNVMPFFSILVVYPWSIHDVKQFENKIIFCHLHEQSRERADFGHSYSADSRAGLNLFNKKIFQPPRQPRGGFVLMTR